MGQKSNAHKSFCSGTLNERDLWEDLRADRRIILKWNLEETGCYGVDWNHVAQEGGKVVCCFENGNELNGFYKTRESMDLPSNYRNFRHGIRKRRDVPNWNLVWQEDGK
jgi:hypothetical protein